MRRWWSRCPKLQNEKVWRATNVLLKQYGGEAVFTSIIRADALFDRGDPQDCSAWVRIATAITELDPHTPDTGDKVRQRRRAFQHWWS